tara:strand:+ start:233 stop:589 length:357 start_codon:yes stop_codon:yes gene_type:complete
MSFRPFDLLNLVRDFGSDVILRQTSTSGAYNPATGTVNGSATTDHTTTSYFFNFSVGLTQGDEVRRGSSRCVIPALGLTVQPDDEDKIIGLGSTYEVVSVQTFYSDGVAVCYICEVRD